MFQHTLLRNAKIWFRRPLILASSIRPYELLQAFVHLSRNAYTSNIKKNVEREVKEEKWLKFLFRTGNAMRWRTVSFKHNARRAHAPISRSKLHLGPPERHRDRNSSTAFVRSYSRVVCYFGRFLHLFPARRQVEVSTGRSNFIFRVYSWSSKLYYMDLRLQV